MAVQGAGGSFNTYTLSAGTAPIGDPSASKQKLYIDTSSLDGVARASKDLVQTPSAKSQQTPLERLANSPTTTEQLALEVGLTDVASSTEFKTDMQTSESRTSEASIAGSLTESGIKFAHDHIDRTGRQSAMNILTKGNAGNLPAKGFANRTEFATEVTNPFNNAANALKETPFSSNSLSTQELASTAQKTKNIGRVAGVVGNIAGVAFGAYEGYKQAPLDSTAGERIANSLGGGLQEIDDTLVSATAGGAAGIANLGGAGLLTFGGVTAPAAPIVLAATPAVAASAAIGASSYYDGKSPDVFFDNAIDNYVEPVIAKTIDTTVSAYEATKSWAGNVFNKLRSIF